MSTPEALRDHLLASLAPLPNAHALGLTVLASTPKRTREIFPHTPHPPKSTQQEWLVVLDSEVPGEDGGEAGKPAGNAVAEADATASPQRVLVSAISAYLYTFPSPSSPSSSPTSTPAPSILYISKVDSSGYTPTPLPLTRHLIRSFLLFFLAHAPRPLRVQLFARAQRQYLFANSADGTGKKVLSGAGLCKWWKGVYEETAWEWVRRANAAGGAGTSGVELMYVLPGYEHTEAQSLLGAGKPLPEGIAWSYDPPFTTPLHPSSFAVPTLATLVPSLPDDPKTRFLEELVGDIPPPPAPTSAPRPAADGAPAELKPRTKKERELEEDEHTRKVAHAVLAKVGVNEFWERMGFRQECASGDVTGFFTLEFGLGTAGEGKGKEKEDVAQGGGALPVPEGTGDDINPTLPTLASSAPAAVSAPVSALIDGPLPSAPTTTINTPAAPAPSSAPKSALIPPAISSRVLTALTNLDFATRALAIEGSGIWLSQTHSIVSGEVGEKGWEQCTGRVEAKVGGEGVGAVRKEREEAPVTMLQPRKKKKKVA